MVFDSDGPVPDWHAVHLGGGALEGADAEALAELQAALNDQLLSRKVSVHTDTCRPGPTTYGSGVPVALGPRRFIFTAGHCAASMASGPLHVCIRREPHTFRVEPARVEWRVRGDRPGHDYGFIEVAATDATTMGSFSVVFSGAPRLLVRTAAEHEQLDDGYLVLVGYPAELHEQTASGLHTPSLLHLTGLAGQGGAPASTLPPPDGGTQVIDLCVDPDPRRLVMASNVPPPPTEVPRFGGVSGGGCWLIPDPDGQLAVAEARLLGIHMGSSTGSPWFARQVMVGHHLKLVAETCADLRDLVYERWPALASDDWAC